MRFWRRCAADPWSGGLIAIAAALFLALQGLIVAFAGAREDGHQKIVDGFVICALTGGKLAPADPNAPLPADSEHLCCCSLATLSPHAKLFVGTALLGVVLLVLREIGGIGLWSPRPRAHRPPSWRTAAAGPRAPPLLSV
jgi:hypothetical protein